METHVPQEVVPDPAARARLSQAAARLFAAKGYAGTSVREIVEAAGVTKPSLYYHFKSKEGIYLELVRDGSRAIRSILEASVPDPYEAADAQICKFCAAIYDFTVQRMDVVRLSYSVLFGPPQGSPPFDFNAVHDEVIASIRRFVRFGVESGGLRGAEEGDITLAVLGALNVALELAMVHPELNPGREGLERVLDVVLLGVTQASPEKE
jgi:TetR/AcrR family transcriptional regulator